MTWNVTVELRTYKSASTEVMREEDLFYFSDSQVLQSSSLLSLKPTGRLPLILIGAASVERVEAEM